MKIIMIDCTAEELRANRTIMDCISDAMNNFTDSLCGAHISKESIAKAMAEVANEEGDEE